MNQQTTWVFSRREDMKQLGYSMLKLIGASVADTLWPMGVPPLTGVQVEV